MLLRVENYGCQMNRVIHVRTVEPILFQFYIRLRSRPVLRESLFFYDHSPRIGYMRVREYVFRLT